MQGTTCLWRGDKREQREQSGIKQVQPTLRLAERINLKVAVAVYWPQTNAKKKGKIKLKIAVDGAISCCQESVQKWKETEQQLTEFSNQSLYSADFLSSQNSKKPP